MKKLIITMCLLVSVVFASSVETKVLMLTKSCDSSNLESCYYLGALYLLGDGVRQDKQKAVKLYTKACDGWYMESCSSLGFFYNNGMGR